MPKSFSIGTRKPALTSVGLAMFVGFTALGFGCNALELLGSIFFGAPKPPLSVCVSPETSLQEGRLKASLRETPDSPASRMESDPYSGHPTVEEEELNRLASASNRHALKALDYSVDRKYWMAIREAKKAIELDPQNFDAYEIRDGAYRSLGIYRKKREIVIQGRVCDVRTLKELNMSKADRRRMTSRKTDMCGMGITDMPLPGF